MSQAKSYAMTSPVGMRNLTVTGAIGKVPKGSLVTRPGETTSVNTTCVEYAVPHHEVLGLRGAGWAFASPGDKRAFEAEVTRRAAELAEAERKAEPTPTPTLNTPTLPEPREVTGDLPEDEED